MTLSSQDLRFSLKEDGNMVASTPCCLLFLGHHPQGKGSHCKKIPLPNLYRKTGFLKSKQFVPLETAGF
jgi:hypothetical protein